MTEQVKGWSSQDTKTRPTAPVRAPGECGVGFKVVGLSGSADQSNRGRSLSIWGVSLGQARLGALSVEECWKEKAEAIMKIFSPFFFITIVMGLGG